MRYVARMLMLDLRTVATYRNTGLAVFAAIALLFVNRPVALVPVLVLLFTSAIAAYPFNIGDKASLGTLYDVLPLPRRAVLYGHYAWAMASYLATVTVGTMLALLFARVQDVPLGGRTLATVLTVSWAVFAVNVAIQFPLFVRFGYTRTSLMGTVLPLAFVSIVVVRLHVSVTAVQPWLPLLWPVGAAAIIASAALTVAADHARRGVS